MQNNSAIHETVIKDIIDVITDVKNSDTLSGVFGKNSFKSVAKASDKLTLVFPVIASRSIAIENSAMVCKAIERKAVSMLQILFSAVSICDATDAADYISKFHTNIKFGDNMSVDDFVDSMDRYAATEEAAGRNIIIDKEKYEAIKEDLKHISYYLPKAISESSLNSFKIFPKEKAEYIIKEADEHIQDLKNYSDSIKNQVIDSDIKKSNELMPTTMIVNFVSTGAGDTPIGVNNVIIGVKAKLYPVNSMDIINRIVSKNKDGQGLLNFVKATTREISFWKDFVFAIDKAKIDALNSSSRGSSSKMWKVLERRSLKSKINRNLGLSNSAIAISTLVLSQEEVEYMKKNNHLDLNSGNVARYTMESYNLMGLAIVDESVETTRFLFDTGDDTFETLSFSHLERESSDNGYKKIINLMTKISR